MKINNDKNIFINLIVYSYFIISYLFILYL